MRQTFLWLTTPSLKDYFKPRSGKAKLLGIFSYLILIFSNFRLKSAIRNLDNSIVAFLTEKNQGDLAKLQTEMCKINPRINLLDYSGDFLEWRTQRNPNIDCSEYYFYEGNSIVGHVVFSKKKKRAHVLSLLYSQESKLNKLLLTLSNTLKELGFNSFTFQGNYENSFNQKIFDLISKLNNRKIPVDGWDFVLNKSLSLILKQ